MTENIDFPGGNFAVAEVCNPPPMTQSQLYHQALSLNKKTLSGWGNHPLNAE
jgi:hypothetical protein